jgi:hypothetical protein
MVVYMQYVQETAALEGSLQRYGVQRGPGQKPKRRIVDTTKRYNATA